MRYQLELTDKAQWALRTLPTRLGKDVLAIILDQQAEPRPPDSQALVNPGENPNVGPTSSRSAGFLSWYSRQTESGRDWVGLRRIQVDGWRIIYQEKDDRVITTSHNAPCYSNMAYWRPLDASADLGRSKKP